MLSQVSAVFTRPLRIGIYTAVFSTVTLLPDSSFWTTPLGWLLALVFYDFCYYWLHRAGHRSAVFWAAHVVHHQSQDYNLSTALRQTSSGATPRLPSAASWRRCRTRRSGCWAATMPRSA